MTSDSAPARSQKSIFVFWVPLAATWLMMALEGPFLAAVIARLPNEVFNLAAYGVTLAVAFLVEAPVVMLMTASTALASNRVSFVRLRRFAYGLCAWVTVVLLVVLIPPVFDWISGALLALPDEVADLTYGALRILLPWPAAIGYRRFYQGLLIRDGRTRLVAVGTVIRLVSMAATGLVLALFTEVPGAWVAAGSLCAGVCAEALASAIMARPSVRRLYERAPAPTDEELSYRSIGSFYLPLALTSLIGFAVQPMLTFFMGRAPAPIESLAVFPVVTSLGFMFRAAGLAFQEVCIALLGDRNQHLPELRRFGWTLGLVTSGALALVAITPLAVLWFEVVSGLTPELARFAILPTLILAPLPLASVVLSFVRALLVTSRRTQPITIATIIEVATVGLTFPLLSQGFDMVGVTAAASSFLAGRTAALVWLIPVTVRQVRRQQERA